MEKYRNFSLFITLIPTPDFPQFYYKLGGNLGSLLYGDVSVMTLTAAGVYDCCLTDVTFVHTYVLNSLCYSH